MRNSFLPYNVTAMKINPYEQNFDESNFSPRSIPVNIRNTFQAA